MEGSIGLWERGRRKGNGKEGGVSASEASLRTCGAKKRLREALADAQFPRKGLVTHPSLVMIWIMGPDDVPADAAVPAAVDDDDDDDIMPAPAPTPAPAGGGSTMETTLRWPAEGNDRWAKLRACVHISDSDVGSS